MQEKESLARILDKKIGSNILDDLKAQGLEIPSSNALKKGGGAHNIVGGQPDNDLDLNRQFSINSNSSKQANQMSKKEQTGKIN